MNNVNVTKATNDIQLIKEVIERTTDSIISLSKTFILIGFIFLGESIINSIVTSYVSLPPNKIFATFLSMLLVWADLIVFIYIFNKSHKTPIIGMNKQIINIWLSVFGFQILVGFIGNIFLFMFNISNTDNPSNMLTVVVMTFAFGFLAMSILSNHKLPGIFALIYTLTGLYFMLPNPLTSNSFISAHENLIPLTNIVFYMINYMAPIAFLSIGYHLKFKNYKR